MKSLRKLAILIILIISIGMNVEGDDSSYLGTMTCDIRVPEYD